MGNNYAQIGVRQLNEINHKSFVIDWSVVIASSTHSTNEMSVSVNEIQQSLHACMAAVISDSMEL